MTDLLAPHARWDGQFRYVEGFHCDRCGDGVPADKAVTMPEDHDGRYCSQACAALVLDEIRAEDEDGHPRCGYCDEPGHAEARCLRRGGA